MAGKGRPVLLLHGFPETHYCWHRVAPGLADQRRVVVCDLKGYGESRAELGGELGEGYSNRERADELVELMGRLGHERFAVVGHDRGGRVAYRMTLDHPDAVERLGVLNIVPTVDQFERMGEGAALEYWPWFFLAQPPPFAQRVMAASAEYFVRDILATWTATPDAVSTDAADRHVEAFTPETISGMCADYRASFHIDRQMDAEDRDAGRRIECPVLVHWGAEEGGDVRLAAGLARLGRARRGRPASLGPLHSGRGARGTWRVAAEILERPLIGSAEGPGLKFSPQRPIWAP